MGMVWVLVSVLSVTPVWSVGVGESSPVFTDSVEESVQRSERFEEVMSWWMKGLMATEAVIIGVLIKTRLDEKEIVSVLGKVKEAVAFQSDRAVIQRSLRRFSLLLSTLGEHAIYVDSADEVFLKMMEGGQKKMIFYTRSDGEDSIFLIEKIERGWALGRDHAGRAVEKRVDELLKESKNQVLLVLKE